jgi:hypothetical protein
MLNLQNCNTIENLISYGKQLDISHDKLHLKTSITTDENIIIINFDLLLDKYMDYIENNIIEIELTDKEYEKYKFQPKLFCYERYGTIELWSSILRINNLTSLTEFNLKKLRIFNDKIFNIINEILTLEKSEIKRNKSENGL